MNTIIDFHTHTIASGHHTTDTVTKMAEEAKKRGRACPFLYIGKGKLINPRPSDNPAKTLLFDIVLDQPIPASYHYDLGIEEKKDIYGEA